MGLKLGIPTLDGIPLAINPVNLNSNKLVSVTDPTNPQDATTKNYVDLAIAGINQGVGSGVISGCGVAWSGTGLAFVVSAGTYSIVGVTYSINQTTVTLATADPTNPRIDAIIVDNTGTASSITGTPSTNPSLPTVDASSQLALSFVYVAAGSTTPGVTTVLVYDENLGAPAEWNSSSNGTTWNLASTNNPFSGTHDTEATSLSSGAYVQYQQGSGTQNPATINNFVFNLRSKATWASNRTITITLYNGATPVGSGVVLRQGTFGWNSSNTTSYQQIVIPMTNFGTGSTAFNTVRFTQTGTGTAIGFYLDYITFQIGNSNVNSNAMIWRGTYNAGTSYSRNDTAIYGGRPFVALVANLNSLPSDTSANWQSAVANFLIFSGGINSSPVVDNNGDYITVS